MYTWKLHYIVCHKPGPISAFNCNLCESWRKKNIQTDWNKLANHRYDEYIVASVTDGIIWQHPVCNHFWDEWKTMKNPLLQRHRSSLEAFLRARFSSCTPATLTLNLMEHHRTLDYGQFQTCQWSLSVKESYPPAKPAAHLGNEPACLPCVSPCRTAVWLCCIEWLAMGSPVEDSIRVFRRSLPLCLFLMGCLLYSWANGCILTTTYNSEWRYVQCTFFIWNSIEYISRHFSVTNRAAAASNMHHSLPND